MMNIPGFYLDIKLPDHDDYVDPFTADMMAQLMSQRPRTEEDAKREYVAETPSVVVQSDGTVLPHDTIQVGNRVRYALQSDLDENPFEFPRKGVVREVDRGTDSAVVQETPGRFLHRVRLRNVIRLA